MDPARTQVELFFMEKALCQETENTEWAPIGFIYLGTNYEYPFIFKVNGK